MIKNFIAFPHPILLLMLLNSGCIFLTDDKIAGIPFLREVYLAALLFITVFLLLTWKQIRQSKTSVWIIFFGIVLPTLSAVLAKMNWGQPVLYGLLEERRSFAYLIFFPTYFLLIKTQPTQEQIQRYMLISGLVCVILGYLYYFKLIEQNTNIFFEVDAKNGSDLLRPDRYRIGAGYVNLCALMLMYSIRRHLTIFKLIALGIFAIYLWTVLQTRNIMILWALSGIWVFRNRPNIILQVGAFAAVLLAITYFITPDAVVGQYEKFLLLLDEANKGPGVRDLTIAISTAEVEKNNFLGLGALSLQWNDGFSRIYNEWFYLSDVGIFGIYYRFGIFAPFIAILFYFGFIAIMRECHEKGDLLAAYKLDFVFSLINVVLSNSIMFGGDYLGLAAAIFLYISKTQPLVEQRKRVNPL